jgi:prepilin-type N-terminal cleavage/methylation domain-containing protein
MKKRKAFTIVELVIVMAVIAALLTALIPVAIGAVRKAEASKIAQNLRAIQKALEEYCLVHNPMTGPKDIHALESGIRGRINDQLYGIQQITDDGQFLEYFVFYKGEDFSIKEVVEHFVHVHTCPTGDFFGVYVRFPVMW